MKVIFIPTYNVSISINADIEAENEQSAKDKFFKDIEIHASKLDIECEEIDH